MQKLANDFQSQGSRRFSSKVFGLFISKFIFYTLFHTIEKKILYRCVTMKFFKNLVFLVYRGENKIHGKKWRHGKMKKFHFEILISNKRLGI